MPSEQDQPPILHELEREIMEELWRSDEGVRVRAVRDALNGRDSKQRAYTTVMTVLVRLEGKGLVRRERRGITDFYSPLLSREEYLDQRAGAEVGALVDEFGEVALVHFARQMAQLDPKRRAQLRRLAGKG